MLREFEPKLPGRLREFAVVARTFLEGLGDAQSALGLLERVVASGYVCYPSMARDPWLDPVRKKPAFTRLQRREETLHQEAAALFAAHSIPRRTSSL